MTFEEFGQALRGSEEDFTIQFSKKITDLFMRQDKEGLISLLREFENSDSVHRQLMNIIVKNALYSIDSRYSIEDSDRILLTEYLYSIEFWTNFELYIFVNTMGLLTDEDLIFLLRDLLNNTDNLLSLRNNVIYLKRILINAISEVIDRKLTTYTDFLIKKLESLVTPYDLFETVFLTYYKLILEYGDDRNLLDEKKAEFINHLSFFGNQELVQLFTSKFQQYQGNL